MAKNSDKKINEILDGVFALKNYQNGIVLDNDELDSAIYFCEIVDALSNEHSDFRVFRFYRQYENILLSIREARKEDKKKNNKV